MKILYPFLLEKHSKFQVHDYLLTPNDLAMPNGEQKFLTIPLPEYNFQWVKRPNLVMLYKNESIVFTGSVTFKKEDGGATTAIIDLTNLATAEEQSLLFDALALKTIPMG